MSVESVRNAAGAATIVTIAPANWLAANAATISIMLAIGTFIVFFISAAIGSYATLQRNKIDKRRLIQEILDDAESARSEVKTHIHNHFRGNHET